jgi:two-component system chemotaxis response regulator CheB
MERNSGKIRVCVVDDSAVIRKVLSDVLSEDPEIEVVATAANGRLALEQLEQADPDVITLDMDMPELNGLQTVAQIRQRGKQVPIIMCSSLTAAGAALTLEALALGASDFVTKPSSHGANARDVVGAELIQKIKALHAAGHHSTPGGAPTPTLPVAQLESALSGPATAVAIGVSTGGPNALAQILGSLSPDIAVPILIVQHMQAVFTPLLVERLRAAAKLPVVEGEHGSQVLPGRVYLAPGGQQMQVKRVCGRVLVKLSDGPPENSCCPSVDPLFRSVAQVYGATSLGVILTGMGQDGLRGCEAIRAANGRIVAQDRASSAVWGMPGAVVEAGLAHAVIPLERVAAAIREAVRTTVATRGPAAL